MDLLPPALSLPWLDEAGPANTAMAVRAVCLDLQRALREAASAAWSNVRLVPMTGRGTSGGWRPRSPRQTEALDRRMQAQSLDPKLPPQLAGMYAAYPELYPLPVLTAWAHVLPGWSAGNGAVGRWHGHERQARQAHADDARGTLKAARKAADEAHEAATAEYAGVALVLNEWAPMASRAITDAYEAAALPTITPAGPPRVAVTLS